MSVVADLLSIVTIYNQAVEAGFETADTIPWTVAGRQDWLAAHTPDTHPVFVFETAQGIAGWVSLSPYRKGRLALRYTAEISYYVHRDFRRQGIGRQLVAYAIAQAKNRGFYTLFAIIIDRNTASIALLEQAGFTQWGYLPAVADFDGEKCGHCYYGLRIGD